MERLTERYNGYIRVKGCTTLYGSTANAIVRLADYEDTGLMPGEITTAPWGCVFYCNRFCNLNGDFCAEGPGCPYETDSETAMHLLERARGA